MQDDRCTGFLDGWPAWLGGTGDEWVACCIAHDRAFEIGLVDFWTHVDLGRCVAESGGWILGLLMGAATVIFWILKYKNHANRR